MSIATMSSDTADLAVDAVSDGWRLNPPNYPQAKRLIIEADGGGSHAARSRRDKKRRQEFADDSRLTVTVCHDPAGTSQWNPIEHRLFSQIAATWAGHVLSTLLVLRGWIRRTTTQTGLKVTATHFDKQYQTEPQGHPDRVQSHPNHPQRHLPSMELHNPPPTQKHGVVLGQVLTVRSQT